MRLYFKLTILILLTVAIHKHAVISKNAGEFWFGMRCQLAYTMNDQKMIDRMVAEAHQRMHAEWAEFAARANAAGGS